MEAARCLGSLQEQQGREGGGDLVFIDFGALKALRIDGMARVSKRRVTLAASRDIDASPPWERRILLDPDISERLGTEDIPDCETRARFTEGKALWQENAEGASCGTNVLGVGGSNLDREAHRFLGGNTHDDRRAVGRGDKRMAFIVIRELPRMGMEAHVDPDAYPDAPLVPRLPRWA